MATNMGQEITVDFNVPAKMRDGTILRANMYRPSGEGQWPVLLTRLPYGKDLPLGSSTLDPVQAARRGYVVIVQDTRGRGASEGEWVPLVNEALDGVDTIEWASQLPYSNGKVGMYGASYFGFTQWIAALRQPPALRAMVPLLTWSNSLDGSTFRGGAFELGISANWQILLGLDELARRHRGDPQSLGRAIYMLVKETDALGPQSYWSLPLKDFGPLKRTNVGSNFFTVVEHGMSRTAYEPVTIEGKYERVAAPSYNVGGWYDIFLQGTLTNFKCVREQGSTPEARQSKLLIGPWSHGQLNAPVGELNFGFASTAAFVDMKFDALSLQLRWYDHFLKGIDTGILKEPPIKLFVMGANVWRDEHEWPLARAKATRYYLHSDGRANTLNGDGLLSPLEPQEEASDRYDYDPANPVMTRGGALLMTPEYPAGPFDQRPTEGRADVLTYTTPPLEQDIEVTGPISVHLWAVSSAPDTDFVARLVDVYPDGYAQNLTDGILRARYRHFLHGEQPSLIEPGRAYEYEIDLWATSNVFKKGHAIRLDVTSSNFPRWDRNPNTGHDFGTDVELVVAHQTILHDAEHPSYVVLPVVPPE